MQRRETDGALAQPFGIQPVFVEIEARRQDVGDALMKAGDEDATDAGFAHALV